MSEIYVMGKRDPVKIICPDCLRVLTPRSDNRLRIHTNPKTEALCPESGRPWDPVGVDVEEATKPIGFDLNIASAVGATGATGVPGSGVATQPNAFRAAERVREVLEKAREDNYLSCWPAYASGRDVEILLEFVERHKRG